MTLQRAENPLEVLRNAAKEKVSALGKKNAGRLLFAGILDGSGNKLSIISTALSKAKTEDELWGVIGQVTQLEKEMASPSTQKIAAMRGIIAPIGKKMPFLDYIVQAEMPKNFVETALDFRQEVNELGRELEVDSGVVFSKGFGKDDSVAGHVVRTYYPQPAVHSEYPKWVRRGDIHDFAVSCSIKLYGEQLGFSGASVRAFIYSRMDQADDFSQAAFGQMESRYRIFGFSLELNEDGERLHAYFISRDGKLTATLFGKTLTVPPEAWRTG